MNQPYSINPTHIKKAKFKEINCFNQEIENANVDKSVVESFGEEWGKFDSFTKEEIEHIGNMYFDILDEKIINKNTYAMDVGCGTGRWTKFLLDKIGFMEAVDPSDAIYSADRLLAENNNVRLTQASTDNLPFKDETFDFAMSIGVLHHIPDTQKAMTDCVKKVKIGGHFYTYLYYDFENKSSLFKFVFKLSTVVRKIISSLPASLKKIVCDAVAIFIYMPFVLLGRFFNAIGLNKIGALVPLNFYQNQTFFVIRNDALDRFGTSLEQRFSRKAITEMMNKAGLENIVISDGMPYWHAVGKRVR
ncbi:MAG: hypothetical protein RI955_1292 [Bacteroidota bacterium]